MNDHSSTAYYHYTHLLFPKEQLAVRTALITGQDLNFGDPYEDILSFIPYTRRDECIAVLSKMRRLHPNTWKLARYRRLGFVPLGITLD